MRLLKIFGLLTFPVFRHRPNFDSQKSLGIRPLLSTVKTIAKLIENLTKRPESTGKCQKCQKYTGIFENVSTMSKITINFWNFWHIPFIKGYKMAQITLKIVKIWPKIPKIVPRFLTVDFWPSTFDHLLLAFRLMSKIYRKIRLFIFTKVGIILQNYTEVRNAYRSAWP